MGAGHRALKRTDLAPVSSDSRGRGRQKTHRICQGVIRVQKKTKQIRGKGVTGKVD